MSLQVLSRGSHQQIVNGKNIVNKHYGVSLDTNRNKSKQVQALVVNNNKQYKFQDSLEHFLRKMSSNKSSLFDLLEKEKEKEQEHAPTNIKSTMLLEPRETRKTKKANKIKGTRGTMKPKKARRTRKA
jgi:SUMO ligase MMS21 Smc5/6 complex component